MSEDDAEYEGTAGQVHDPNGHGSSPRSLGTTRTGVTRRQALVDQQRRLLDKGTHAVDRVKASTAGSVWTRLNAVDFMNSSMQFAALGVLCLFPFLIVVSAGTGHDLRKTVITRMGLDQHAAKDVNTLIAPGNHAVTSLSIVGGALILFGAIGIASTLQGWYQRVYEQPPAKKWSRQLMDRLAWLGGFIVYLASQEFVATRLSDVGARIPTFVVTFVIAVIFYWWTLHVLLLGRVAWRELFPGGLATAVCVTGLSVFSTLLFSGQIVSSDNDYGPIGVVMILLSYLVGVGVCFHLGAVIGRAWNERKLQATPDIGPTPDVEESHLVVEGRKEQDGRLQLD
ncbi:MAG TPA: YhjD/YihY/BrkB family envelope integrity protein [Acidimicrobiales bacterium]|nr:YhjD/YihY/BrkB family envelope integrity protein [Acidimicrobiales bacterium]